MPCTLRALPIIAALALVGCGDGIQDASSIASAATQNAAQSDADAFNCRAVEHSEFDFLVGSWSIRYDDEEPFAEFEIEKSPDGCTLHGVGKYTDGDTRSFFGFYDPGARRWKQLWISGGFALDVQSVATDSQSRRLVGTLYLGTDWPALSAQLTHEPQADGTIREYLPVSTDGGKNWTSGRSAVWSRKSTVN